MESEEPASPEPVRRRPGGRAARVREAVLAAAAEAVIEHGVAKLTIADVAARAGVNETTVYRRWGTRENLVLDALRTASDQGIPVPDTGDVHTDLTTFATALADYLATPLGHAVGRAAVLGADDPALAEAWRTFWQARLDQAAVMIHRAVDRGELPAGTDAALAVELVAAPVQSRALLGHRAAEPGFAGRLAAAVLDGLRGR
ncbi:TetR/AcrR family transcriptional regulator [Kitasatospora sp. NPDC093558]|uniref:TetR/AcrR family transcriptional regulator n=1 Tax=Kitasatospora sp. NPDC093558 TaxID=3155201 RepID=UPI00343C9ACE